MTPVTPGLTTAQQTAFAAGAGPVSVGRAAALQTAVTPGLATPTIPAGGISAFAGKLLTEKNLDIIATGVRIGGILQRGQTAEDIAAQRAAIDRANAEAVRKASVERAKILTERGRRLKARQKSQFITKGIRTNVGVPLLVETQTRADITADIGFSLDVGRVEAGRFLTSAQIEKDIGKFRKKRSKFEAIGVGAERGLSFLGT